MDQLMQKLMMSKAIMDKSDRINRGTAQPPVNINPSMLQEFDAPQAKYNIPENLIEGQNIPKNYDKPLKTPTADAIKNSKLPDEIKKLMIEHPISQPQMQSTAVLSDELVEKASRLMRENSNNYVPDSAKTKTNSQSKVSTPSNIDYDVIKDIVKNVVEETLRENGIISESTEKTNELFSFKVGKHIFEGKVTKIKKLQ